MELRRAGVEDAQTITDIYLASRDAAPMPPGIHPPDDVRDYTRSVLPDRNVWLAIVDDQPVGVLLLQGDQLNWLFVRPEAQGTGVGTALLEQAKRECPTGLALWVFEMNTPAQQFYARHGFVEVRRTDGDNEEGEPDIRLVWGDHPERLTL
jgi:GNAT superfamily N-acetyltransferase